jgi:hypothetical protein
MMKALYGFGKPYDFRKILPFLAGVFLLLTILAAAGARFADTGYLSWGALRDAYSLYLIVLSLAGTLLSISPSFLSVSAAMHWPQSMYYQCRFFRRMRPELHPSDSSNIIRFFR